MKAPSAKRKILVALAGLLWSAVGMALLIVGWAWLYPLSVSRIFILIAGLAVGIIVSWFGFTRLAQKNLDRICSQAPGKDKVCIFAFQNRRSYILVGVMISMGYIFRHSPLPKIYLAPVYLAMGLGLLLASTLYYRHLIAQPR